MQKTVLRQLGELGVAGLTEINSEILDRASELLPKRATVHASAVQRHFRTQKSPSSIDATLTFRLETTQVKRARGHPKPQHEWVQLYASLPLKKRSNMQFEYQVHLPWGTPGLDKAEAVELVADSWCALKPFLDALKPQDD